MITKDESKCRRKQPRRLEVKTSAATKPASPSGSDKRPGNYYETSQRKAQPRKLEVRHGYRSSAKLDEIATEEELIIAKRARWPRKLKWYRPAAERVIDPTTKPLTFEKVHLSDPLKSPRHIRLLHLNARDEGDKRDHVACEVYQASLDDLATTGQPIFAALSYAWGDATPRHTIQCGTSKAPVADNLYKALVHVRYPHQRRLLWVDAISIDQQNIAEKNISIPRMGDIYANAHVVIWLGEEGHIEETAIALKFIQWLTVASLEVQRDDNADLEVLDIVTRTKEKALSILGISDEFQLPWLPILRFFARPWFERLWVVQERHLGRTCSTHIGDLALEPEMFEHALYIMTRLYHPGAQASRQEAAQLYSVAVRAHRNAEHTDYIRRYPDHERVLRYKRLICRDPRDRIYGLIQLLSSGTSFQVDYGLCTVQVYARFTLHCVETQRSLTVLGVAARRVARREYNHLQPNGPKLWTPGLPSWCPDWAMDHTSTRELLTFGHYRKSWRASGNRSLHHKSSVEHVLGLRGIVLGRISTTSTVAMFLPDSEWRYGVCSWKTVAFSQQSKSERQLWLRFLDVITLGRNPMVESELEFRPDPDQDVGKWSEENTARSLWSSWVAYVYGEASAKAVWPSVTNGFEARGGILKQLKLLTFHMNRKSRLFRTNHGHLGSSVEGIRVGDLVCIMDGAQVPYVLRQSGIEGQYEFLGDAYVHGFMEGEAMDLGLEVQEFALI